MPSHRKILPRARRAAVTVELALVAPMFLAITVGVCEVGRMLDAQNQLAIAAREGARMAAMDRSELLSAGQTTNQKVISDVTGILAAAGLPVDDITIEIVDPENHTTPFDLDDPDNQLELIEVRIELPLSAQGGASSFLNDEAKLTASVVFRNAPSTLVQ